MRRGDPRLAIAAFLLMAVVSLAGLVIFARFPSLFRSGRQYHARFTSVAGLNLGGDVRYGGLAVGSVTGLDLDPRDPAHIVVTFRVRRSTPVRSDTRASITQVGLLGEPFLNLVPGRPDSPSVPSGTTLASENTVGFSEAFGRLATFLERADTVLLAVERLSGQNPLARVDRTLARVETLIASASTSSERVLARLDVAAARLNDVLVRTDHIVAALDTSLNTARPGLASTQREALATLKEVHVLVADLRDALNEGGGVEQLVRNLAVATDNVARLSARLEREPTSLFKRREPPQKTAGPSIRE
ncbi:MAG: MlaD family protein [Gemmatimonadaceae bacterium]